jgi:hypothetical protein
MSVGAKRMLKAIGKLKPTDWKKATPAAVTTADFKSHIEAKLDYFKFRTSAPIRQILSGPTDLYVASGMSNPALLTALMGNMYAYGRANWTWVRGSPKGALEPYEDSVKAHIASLEFPAQLRWKMGRGLLDGTVDSAVCGSFNSAFKFIAYEIFDIPNVKTGTGDATTQIPDSFITMPGSQPIDGDWKGNVWLLGPSGDVASFRRSNEQIRALRFTGHYFVNHNGTIYDVTANKTYTDANQMIWCLLSKNDTKTGDFPGTRNVFDVRVVNTSTIAKPGRYCIDMGDEPSGDADRFSNFALTDRESLTAQEMKTLSTWSSCA